MNIILSLQEKLNENVAEMRKMTENSEIEDRDFSEAEQTRWNDLDTEVTGLQNRIARLEKQDSVPAQVRSNTPNHKPVPNANVGMSDKDLRNYSLVRAINAAANGDWSNAGLEKEASQATEQRLGKEANGFYIPFDWMASNLRDLNVTTTTAGGFLVDTDFRAENFIDVLRNKMVLRQAGVTMLTGLVGPVAVPKQTAGSTAYWVAESNSPTESQLAVAQMTLSGKTVGAYTDFSRKLLKQSSMDVESLVRNDLATTLAVAIDAAGLHGLGSSNQPTGIAATAGIGSVVGGTNGAAPDFADIVGLETAVAVDNADIGNLAYITNAKVRGVLKQTEKASGTAQFVWPDSVNPIMNGYRVLTSNQVSSTLTKGTADSICSAIFFGNWADLVVGMWGGLDIMVDPYTGGTAGTVRVVALQDVDIAVRHAESFAAMLDALTA